MIPSPPETRASLILRLRDPADFAAWEEFVGVYEPLVYRMGKRQGLQPADAEDVVQEVFAAVARSVGAWLEQPNRGRFRSWLLGIARNIAINLLTRRPRGAIGIGGDRESPLGEVPAATNSLSTQFDLECRREVYRWAAARVRETVARTTWEAFQRTHVEGVPIAAAAAQLEISVGNVYLARSRVMSRLRALVKQFEVSE